MDLLTGEVLSILVGGSGAIAQENDVMVKKVTLTGSRFDAHIRGYARHDQRADPPRTQDHVQIRAMERTLSVLGDDGLA